MPGRGGSIDTQTAPQPADERRTPWANTTLVLVSVLSSLLSIEVGARLATGLPVLAPTNWRTTKVVRTEYKAVVDPVLGWALTPWTDADDFSTSSYGVHYSTIDYGIRPNFGEKTVRTGGILAVGDSFTQGWEVDNDESWPAYLEKLAKVPVVNAGVGGYGTDQIILRAEQLLPIVRPKILIIGFLEADMFRTGHSIFGAPKPYFTLEGGELRYHAPDLTTRREEGNASSSLVHGLREALGYSAAADYLLARLAPNYWYGSQQQLIYKRANNREGEITCALLQRLKARTDEAGIPMMLFMQHHAALLFHTEHSTPVAREVVACAAAARIRVVDQFEWLRPVALKEPYRIAEYYVGMHNGSVYGHMSPKGNQHAAELLYAALQDWLEDLTSTVPPAPAREHAARPN